MRPFKAILFLFVIALQPVWATEPFGFDTTFVASAATSEVAAVADTIAARPAKKKDIFSRFLAYFNDANKEKKNKRFDFSVIGGPHYSSDTKFGIGLVAAGLYRSDPTDSLSAPSNVSLFGDVSTVGFYMLGVRGTKFDRVDLLGGERTETLNFGAGMTAIYDTRDNLTAPKRGMYIQFMQLMRPKFIGNKYNSYTTDFRIDGYTHLWKGATLAADFRTQFNFGDVEWSMLAQLGDSYSMRGYYQGRYRDNHKIETQVELRQHVWKRNGVVAWVGAGTIFPKFSKIQLKHILPNMGVGYRWEFKKNVNVRLDYGFGKSGQHSFIFNINEAF